MNKKLIKTIASITCGLGIVGLISITSTSCKSNNSKMTTTINYSEVFLKDLGTINKNGGIGKSPGVFSIENPDFLKEWSFIVFKFDTATSEYIEFNDWNSVIGIKINDENKLQVTSTDTGAIQLKINVSATLKNDSKTNSIDGFQVKVFC